MSVPLRPALPLITGALSRRMVLAGLAAVFMGGAVDIRKILLRLPEPVAAAGLAAFALVYFLLLPLSASGFIYFNF